MSDVKLLKLSLYAWLYSGIWLAGIIALSIVLLLVKDFFGFDLSGVFLSVIVLLAAGHGTTWEFYKRRKRALSKLEIKSLAWRAAIVDYIACFFWQRLEGNRVGSL